MDGSQADQNCKLLSEFVDVWPNTSHTQTYHRALEIIDSVHRVADLHIRKVAAVDFVIRIMPDGVGLPEGECRREASTGRPISIGVSPQASHPLFTITHEFGHCVDYAVQRTIDFINKEECGNEYRKLHVLLRASEEVERLISAKTGLAQVIDVERPDHPNMEVIKIGLAYTGYLTSPNELFARAYTQYVTFKCSPENSELMNGLAACLEGSVLDSWSQWHQRGFKTILAQFDDLFKCLGWLRE